MYERIIRNKKRKKKKKKETKKKKNYDNLIDDPNAT